jgi:hypothetical protein
MIKKIELNKNGAGRLVEHEPFLLPEEIELEFIAKGYDMTDSFVCLRNGENHGVLRLSGPLKIPNEYLHAGYLNMRVEMYLNGEMAKRWDVLPIKLLEVPNGFEVKDYLGELEEKLAILQEKVQTLEKQHEIIK